MTFEGLTVVVTGAASGIGSAVTHLLQSQGARVVALDLAWTDTPATEGRIVTTTLDVTDEQRRLRDILIDLVVRNWRRGSIWSAAQHRWRW